MRKGRRVKLPIIKLPHLHGDIVDWEQFWKSLNAAINHDSDLTNLEKSTLLTSALKLKEA